MENDLPIRNWYPNEELDTVKVLNAFDHCVRTLAPCVLSVNMSSVTSVNCSIYVSHMHGQRLGIRFSIECLTPSDFSIEEKYCLELDKIKIEKFVARVEQNVRAAAATILERIELRIQQELSDDEDRKRRSLYKRYEENVAGAPFCIGEEVIAMGHCGTVTALDYTGCGQTYPEDPLIVVAHDLPTEAESTQDGYWSEEIKKLEVENAGE